MIPGLLLLAGIGMLAGILTGRAAPRIWLTAMLAGALAALTAAISVLAGGDDWEWRSAFPVGGESLHLRLDGISAFFLVLLCVVGGAASVYAREYWADAAHPRGARTGRVWWSSLLLSLGLVLVASNGLHFLIAWELFTLSAYFLITLDRRRPEVRAAGWLYLGASHAATLSLFAFFAVIAGRTGSWDLGPMRGRAELAPLFWLALFGFGMKAGLFPLHIWLPSAHANAPSHVSAMLSGVTIKMGIYGLVRFSGWLPVPPGAAWVVAALGVASAVLGVAFALGQHDLKRLLAYHSVENIGIILIGIGFALVAAEQDHASWGRLALAGGLLHVWNHGLFKALLFFGAGSVLHATGTREMSRLGGLWRTMPWTAGLFALGAAAISGLPPLNGFVSEWLVFLGLFDATVSRGSSAWAAIPAAVLLGLTGALALACFVKVCGVVFLGAPRSEAAVHAHECGAPMRSAMMVLAAACVAIGLAPVLFRHGCGGGMVAVAARAPSWSDSRTNMGLRLRGPHRPHAVHRRLVRCHHHGMVRFHSSPPASRPSPARPLPCGGELRCAHTGNRPRAGRRTCRQRGDATLAGRAAPAARKGSGLYLLPRDRNRGARAHGAVVSGPGKSLHRWSRGVSAAMNSMAFRNAGRPWRIPDGEVRPVGNAEFYTAARGG
jgi:hydrogenase-4 component B